MQTPQRDGVDANNKGAIDDANAVKLGLGMVIALALLSPISAWAVGNPPAIYVVASGALAGFAWFSTLQYPAISKTLLTVILILQTIMFTAAFQGHPWQIDTHMMYFAVLAVIAIFYQVRLIVAAAGLIAAHHLSMSLMMPQYLYPTMTEGYVLRTLLHAGIVVIEALILSLSIRQRNITQEHLKAHEADMRTAAEMAKVAETEAQAARDEATEAIAIVNEHLAHLSRRDMSRTIETPLPERFEGMRATFNDVVHSLRDVLKTAAETSTDFKASAGELSGAADDLARRTESQSAALTQTAEGLQDLSSALQNTATGAGDAKDTASSARDAAVRNGEIVGDAVAAMRKIEESSGQISSILNMIEDISFQTNLLALNAGVEAARAGESGRGFAVVASEVRALAQRTSQAAQDVKELIVTSSNEVENGSNLVNAAGTALAEIVDQVSQASAMISDISTSIGSQAGLVREMNESIQTLDQATQHNAAMCEEMTAMGRQMAQGSEELSGALSGFSFGTQTALSSQTHKHRKVA